MQAWDRVFAHPIKPAETILAVAVPAGASRVEPMNLK